MLWVVGSRCGWWVRDAGGGFAMRVVGSRCGWWVRDAGGGFSESTNVSKFPLKDDSGFALSVNEFDCNEKLNICLYRRKRSLVTTD
jgi:hypothetical protein